MLKARLLNGVDTGGYAHAFVFTGRNAESMKGGMLMKSKHCTYGKKTDCISYYYHRCFDSLLRKSAIAALIAQGRLL